MNRWKELDELMAAAGNQESTLSAGRAHGALAHCIEAEKPRSIDCNKKIPVMLR